MKKKFFIITIILFSSLIYLSCSNNIVKKHPTYNRIKKSTNFNSEIFLNNEFTTITNGGFFNMAWRYFNVNENTKPNNFKPNFVNSFNKEEFIKKDGIKTLWVGHSTLLINLEGKIILTDPVWSERVSPVQFAGPKRYFKTPIAIEDLPKIDMVLISHDHYDHLDKNSIKNLIKKDPKLKFYAPLGVAAYLEDWGVNKNNIIEFDWWDELTLPADYKLAFAPTRHFSGRGLLNRNITLWGSWIVKSKNHSIYFGGDSGYGNHFKQIGDKYGPFDITLLEIGAYDDDWKAIHMGPKNAVKAHLDLKGKQLIPIHWGTFRLAFHPWKEPADILLEQSLKNKVSVLMPIPGKIYYKNSDEIVYWWNDNQNKLVLNQK